MAPAARTSQWYEPDGLNADKLLALIVQHNAGVRDDVDIATEMDAELSGSTYVSSLEDPGQIVFEGIPESAVDDDYTILPGVTLPPFLQEALFKALVEEQNKRVLGFRAVFTALLADESDLDGAILGEGIPMVTEIQALGYEPNGLVLPDFIFPEQSGISGRLLQRLKDQHSQLSDAWATMAGILDGDILFVSPEADPDGENVGNGTATVLALGPDAVEETITLTATNANTVSVPGDAEADEGNDFDGEITDIVGGLGAPAETITVTYVAGNSNWTVVGSVSTALGVAVTGTPFEDDVISFTIVAGTTPPSNGDFFEIIVTNPATQFEVSGAVSTDIGVADVGEIFESSVITLLIEAGETDFELDDKFEIEVETLSVTGDYAEKQTARALSERTLPVTTGPVIPF